MTQAADGPDGGVPAWFDLVILVIVSAVLSFGSIGVLLAFFGVFHPATVLSLGAVLTAGLAVLGRKPLRRGPRAPLSVLLPAVGILVVAAVSALANAAYDGHYVQVDRDPGVYAVAGEWLAHHDTLEFQAGQPWVSKAVSVDWSSTGMYPEGVGNQRIEFQFAHFVPVLMAEAHMVGGERALFALPALLGALSLCVVYAVGCRLLRRPWLALAAATALGLSLPQLSVSRDSYSETATQLLLWGSAWALLRAWDRRSIRQAVFAGLVLGGAMTTRVDALVYLILAPALLALAWLAARGSADRRRVAVGVVGAAAAVVPGTALGFYDVRDRAGAYYKALASQVHELQFAVIAMAVLSALLVLTWPRLARLSWWPAIRRWSAIVVPVAAVVGLLALWTIRPHVYHPRGSTSAPATAALQQAAGLPVDAKRTYAEQSMNWLGSYLGAPALVLAIIGAAVLLGMAIRRADPSALVVLGLAGAGTALYIWAPSISPDQVFAARRFVPAGLPLLVLCAAVGIEALADVVAEVLSRRAGSRTQPRAAVTARAGARVIAPIGGVLVLIFPLLVLAPVWRFRSQANFISLIRQTCDMIGPHSAVIFTFPDASGRTLNQTLDSFCRVPTANASRALKPADVSLAALKWRAAGDTLWVMSYTAAGVAALAPASAVVRQVGAAVSVRELGAALNKAPSKYNSRTLTLFAAQIPA